MMSESTTNKNKPTMYILAGPNGSGKSTFLAPLIPQDIIRLNADKFAREIAKERGIPDNEIQAAVDNSNAIKLAGMRRVVKRMRQSIEDGKSFSTETVLANNSYEGYIKKAKSNGFEIELLYIGIESPNVNVFRVSDRVAKGGHGVPVEEIVQRYHGSYELLSDHIKMVDKAEIYDNSRASKSARLILSIAHNEIVEKNKPIPKWVNENINKKLYPYLYEEILHEAVERLRR